MRSLRQLAAAAALAGLSGLASATSGYTGLYIFGDSLSDAGNVAALIGANPGQVISGNSYIPSQPYASGQFTNGDVWARTFADSLLGPGTPYGLNSLAGGGNVAFGGARTNTDGPGLAPSLFAQSIQFLTATHGVSPGSALYVIEGGGNDARDALAAAAVSATPQAVIAAAAAAYAQHAGNIVDLLQVTGAKKIIVWDVPNLALAPAVTAQPGASFLAGLVSSAMNQALAQRLAGESGVSIFDLYGFQNTLVADPGYYGLDNVTDACGAASSMCDPRTALFWDGIHPTAAGHALLAQQMLITAVPEPQTWALLAAGLLLIGLRTRRRAAQAAA